MGRRRVDGNLQAGNEHLKWVILGNQTFDELTFGLYHEK